MMMFPEFRWSQEQSIRHISPVFVIFNYTLEVFVVYFDQFWCCTFQTLVEICLFVFFVWKSRKKEEKAWNLSQNFAKNGFWPTFWCKHQNSGSLIPLKKHFFSRYNMFLLIKSCEICNFGLIGVEPLYRVLKGIFKPAFRVPSTQTLVKIYNKYVSVFWR